jgi:hypothetical protein
VKFEIKCLLLCIIFGLFGHYWPELMCVVIWDNFYEYWIGHEYYENLFWMIEIILLGAY